MRAYLKFALILALTFALDHYAFAPRREYEALREEAKYDWVRCHNEMAHRTAELERSSTDPAAKPSLLQCWEIARAEHLRHCRRGHLVDKIIARQHRAWPARPPAGAA